MKTSVCALFVSLLLVGLSVAKESAPKVQVYSQQPGNFGKPNTLICHANGFHPPEIMIELLHNEKKMAGASQTDLAFEEDWHYHLTRSVSFVPSQGDEYSCRVTHMGKTKTYIWEADM